jgi:glycosyltransferase involved in cell wall biosynthesis
MHPMPPRVSLALPVYNGEKFVADAIRSILDQEYSDFELIITDNASTDATEAICRQFATSDDRIKYFRNERNLGAGPNFNLGFKLSSGDYFKWCACDDCLSPNFVASCVTALDLNQSAVLAYGTTQIIDENGRRLPVTDPVLTAMDEAGPVDRFRRVIGEVGTCYEVFGVFRSAVLRQTTLHRPYYGSDRALLAEMALLGSFLHVPEIVFYSREHAGRSINIADKKARIAWHNTQVKTRHSLEHWRLLGHLTQVAFRRRRLAPPGQTLRCILAWAITPLQLSRYGLELIGLICPSMHSRLRRLGWQFAHVLRRRVEMVRRAKT